MLPLRAAQGRCEMGAAGQNRRTPGWRTTMLRASAGLRAPIWPSAAWVSSVRRSMTWDGPRRPSAPSPHRKAFPANVACAPSASARATSAPLRIPESIITVARPATRAATAGSASIAAGSASTWRPPWFDTMRSEEHTSELQSLAYLVCRLLLEKKKTKNKQNKILKKKKKKKKEKKQKKKK